jgi:hypothetical protein
MCIHRMQRGIKRFYRDITGGVMREAECMGGKARRARKLVGKWRADVIFCFVYLFAASIAVFSIFDFFINNLLIHLKRYCYCIFFS